jgi:hypothetical protein
MLEGMNSCSIILSFLIQLRDTDGGTAALLLPVIGSADAGVRSRDPFGL